MWKLKLENSRKSNHTTRRQLLLILGISQTSLGSTWLFPAPTRSRERGFQWIEALEPRHVGLIMMLTGAFAVVSVIIGIVSNRGGKRLEQLGFGALFLPFFLLSFIFLMSWLFGGNHTGWMSSISYGVFSWLTYSLSKVIDPPRLLDSGPITLPTPQAPQLPEGDTDNHEKEAADG